MRNYSKTVGALAAASTLVAGYASAEIEGEFHIGYASQYEFRFVDLGDNLVEAGVDLALGDISGFSFSAGAWYGSTNNSSTTNPFSPGDFNELDLYGGVGYTIGPVALEVGYIAYLYENFADTQEFYASAAVEDIFWGIGAGVTFFNDFEEYNGWYVQPEITKSFEFNECLGLDIAIGAGFADGLSTQLSDTSFFGGTKDGYQGIYASVSLPWEFRENFILAPYVKVTDADSDLVTGVGSAAGSASGQTFVIGGVKLSASF